MGKFQTYANKLERCRTVAATGFRIKQAMYNALLACYKEDIPFPYQDLLDRHCIPGEAEYLKDETFYMLLDSGFVESERTMSEKEAAFRKLAERIGGKVVFTPERDPAILVDGWILNGGPLHANKFTEEFPLDFSTPYPLYPRVININDGHVLVEEAPGVCVWQEAERYAVVQKKGREIHDKRRGY